MEVIDDPMWYRVAALRPRLRLHVRVQRRVTRGSVWYVLVDDERRRSHRLDASAYQLVGQFNGQCSVDEAWRAAQDRLGDAAPTQGEVLRILAHLSDAELLNVQALADAAALTRRRREKKRGLRAAVASPLSFKVPLLDPTRLLQRLTPLARGLFGPWGLAVWLLLVGAAGVHAVVQADALQQALATHAATASFLLHMWATYPFIKLVHEACHALAVRRWGGEVREVGVNLALFNPLPYVDASAANGFPERHRRMAVSAAGVMAELAIAALAVFIWSASSSPAVQKVALAVVAACGVSTLLFNANPLARFDGYHFLCDALDLPNLHARGRAQLGHLVRRLVGVDRAADAPEAVRGEAVTVGAYAVLAWLYQLLVAVAIGAWLYGVWPPIGVGVLLLAGWSLLLQPMGRAGAAVLSDARYNGRRLPLLAGAGATVVGVALSVCLVPAPAFTVQEGIVWTPSEATLRVEAAGELLSLQARPGETVKAGQPIATLGSLELRSERETAQARWQQLDLKYFNALLADPLAAQRLLLERTAVEARLARVDAQLAAMTLRAPQSGQLVISSDKAQPGHVFARGDDVGHVLSDRQTLLVKVAMSEAQAALVRGRTGAVSVRFASAPGRSWSARLERETPAVTRSLPSPVLGDTAGGPIPTDPADTSGRQTLASVAIFDVLVPALRTELIGARAWVRIDHPPEPLAQQWVRKVRQAFLSRLAASA